MSHPRRWLAVTTRVSVIGVLALTTAAIVVVLMTTQPGPGQRAAGAGIPQVPVLGAQRIAVARQWRGYGTVEPLDAANIPSRVTSTVERVPDAIEPGLAVAKGQLIAELDASDFQQQREAAKAQLAELEAELDRLQVQQEKLRQRIELQQEDLELAQDDLARLKRLEKRNAANAQEVDATRREVIAARQGLVQTEQTLEELPAQRRRLQAQVRSQKANLAQAELNLERTRITAPIAGVLQSVSIEAGESVTAGQQIARVVSLKRLEVPIQLPAAARGRITEASPARLHATDGAAQQFDGEITRIGPVQDAEARTITAYIEITQPSAAPPLSARQDLARPGMFLEAVVDSPEAKRRWVLPRRAIRGGALRTIVDGRVVSRPAEIAFTFEAKLPQLGLAGQRQWAALAGELETGQPILINAASSVLDGQRVEAVAPAQAEAPNRATQEPES
jgi:RND family efflux transporter MFP subunit